MISRTKPELTIPQIKAMFHSACLGNVLSAHKLGDGEYNAVYKVKTDMGEYVLKVSPLDDTQVLTYEKDMMRGEVFWYAQMRANTDIKVPYVYYKDFSHTVYPADYFIMEYMQGTQLNDADLTEEEKSRCTQMLAAMSAQLHKVTNDKYGYLQNGLYDNWYLALTSMISNLIGDAKRVHQSTKRGERLLKYAVKYKSVLESVSSCMVNYDIWDANILCCRNEDNSLNLIWIDPERSLWGDYIFEFSNLEVMKSLPDKIKSIEAYNAVSRNKITCTREQMIRYAFGIGYLGLVQEVEKYYRYTPAHYGWWRNIFSSGFLYNRAFRILRGE